jgi:hypothetical protein
VDLHGAIVLRVAGYVKKMAAALASGTDFSAENQNPRSDRAATARQRGEKKPNGRNPKCKHPGKRDFSSIVLFSGLGFRASFGFSCAGT